MDAAVKGTLGREVPSAGFRGRSPLIYSSRNLGTVAWGDMEGGKAFDRQTSHAWTWNSMFLPAPCREQPLNTREPGFQALKILILGQARWLNR